MRGPAPAHLDIRADPAELRAWTLENLDTYWRRWAARARRPLTARRFPHQRAAYGVLGVSRPDYTLATGEIATKQAAGEYALRRFDPEWRPLIEAALACWRGTQPAPRIGRAADFVDYVIDLTARSV
jgi:hypothetical protein